MGPRIIAPPKSSAWWWRIPGGEFSLFPWHQGLKESSLLHCYRDGGVDGANVVLVCFGDLRKFVIVEGAECLDGTLVSLIVTAAADPVSSSSGSP